MGYGMAGWMQGLKKSTEEKWNLGTQRESEATQRDKFIDFTCHVPGYLLGMHGIKPSPWLFSRRRHKCISIYSLNESVNTM